MVLKIAAIVEIAALGIWVGALSAFAFLFAPAAFRIIAPGDVARFASLVGTSLSTLIVWSYLLGGLAALAAIVQRAPVRAALAALALVFVAYEQAAILPPMRAATDVGSAAYHALHAQSTRIYGAALLLAFATLLTAAAGVPRAGARESRRP